VIPEPVAPELAPEPVAVQPSPTPAPAPEPTFTDELIFGDEIYVDLSVPFFLLDDSVGVSEPDPAPAPVSRVAFDAAPPQRMQVSTPEPPPPPAHIPSIPSARSPELPRGPEPPVPTPAPAPAPAVAPEPRTVVRHIQQETVGFVDDVVVALHFDVEME